MSTYPGYPAFNPGVPADSTGYYPNLAGYTPMDTGRRVVVALVDSLLAWAALGLCGLSLYLTPRSYSSAGTGQLGIASVIAVGVVLGVAIAELWAMFAKSSRLSGVFLGATYVDVATGLPAGGKLFLKYLLTSLIGSISAGLAPLIMYFVTVQEPLKRNWFDRSTGLMLVDTRTGRRPGQPRPAEPAHTPPPAVAAVQFPPANGAEPARPYTPAAQFQTPAAYTPPAPYQALADSQAQAPAAYTPQAPAAYMPPASPEAPAVVPITGAGGLITSTPHSAGAPTPQPVSAPASFAPEVVVRDMRSVDAAQSDRTALASEVAPAPADASACLRLDDGSLVTLTPPTVLGRNPVAPGSHPDAVARAVNDNLASKTHLIVGTDDKGPWVIDLHSTNGVSVSKVPGTPPAKIEAGRKVHLPAGAVVAFGGRTLTAV